MIPTTWGPISHAPLLCNRMPTGNGLFSNTSFGGAFSKNSKTRPSEPVNTSLLVRILSCPLLKMEELQAVNRIESPMMSKGSFFILGLWCARISPKEYFRWLVCWCPREERHVVYLVFIVL